jgi:hypothetical protein
MRNLFACRLPGIHQRFGIGEKFFSGRRQADIVAMA